MVQPALHDRAVIISTGDEIMTGQLQDSNARWLSERLVAAGIVPIEHAAVGDALPDLIATLRRAAELAPLVIMSGGLGPTDGDLTRQAWCEVLGDDLVIDDAARETIAQLLSRRGREVSERQLRQAHRPRSARCLPNALGTAPGLHARVRTEAPPPPRAHAAADLFALPGPPGELRPMFEQHVRPLLRPRPGQVVLTRLLHVVALPEADCVSRLGDLTVRDRNPLVGITASGGILTIRIRFEGAGEPGHATAAVDADEQRIRQTLGDHVVATPADPRFPPADESGGASAGLFALGRTVLSALAEGGRTLATVESCTGGLLGEIVTSVPGASVAYVGGFITYSNDQKQRLGVDPGVLAQHGAVSRPVAEQLAARGRAAAAADHCLSITGIAGPGGGSEAKPVGTVHIGHAAAGTDQIKSRHFVFTGDRTDIRRRAAASALTMLYFALRGSAGEMPRLLWEVR